MLGETNPGTAREGGRMVRFTITHEIECDEDTFWKVFFDRTFNDRLYRGALGFPEFQVLEQTETDTQITRRAVGMPKMNLPGPVMKVLGPGFRYTEEGTFDRAQRIFRWRMTPSVLADKLRQEGTVRTESLGPGRVRRIAELMVEARVLGLGGLMESSAERQLREGWDTSAVFMNQYLRQQQGSP
ncbi:MAG: DUF2505 family protein [Myxococcota bacterium]|nr:DUF2505 family protein [Myxococcota bacterium]